MATVAAARSGSDGERAFDVEKVDRGEWQFEITFDDVVAHVEEDRVAAFVGVLDAEERVERAVHEDREIVLIKAGILSEQEMDAAAWRAWETAGDQVGRATEADHEIDD